MVPRCETFMHKKIYIYLYRHIPRFYVTQSPKTWFMPTSHQMTQRIPPTICTSYVDSYKHPHTDNDSTPVPSCEWQVMQNLTVKNAVFLKQICPPIALKFCRLWAKLHTSLSHAYAAFMLPCQVCAAFIRFSGGTCSLCLHYQIL